MRLSDKAYELIRHKIITLEMPPLSAIDESVLLQRHIYQFQQEIKAAL